MEKVSRCIRMKIWERPSGLGNLGMSNRFTKNCSLKDEGRNEIKQ